MTEQRPPYGEPAEFATCPWCNREVEVTEALEWHGTVLCLTCLERKINERRRQNALRGVERERVLLALTFAMLNQELGPCIPANAAGVEVAREMIRKAKEKETCKQESTS
jgi:hypothetical protein